MSALFKKKNIQIGSKVLQVISKFEAFVNQNEPKIGVASCGERWRCNTGETPDHFPTENTQLCGRGK
jgi:beta-lactamase superfamily II metal-dependent hydrolase